MNEKIFRFKKFTLKIPHQIGMPISTDGVLLGAWALSGSQSRILDIGTGSGLLAMMCAQRHSKANIEAIELEVNAYHTASCNFLQSPWSERLHSHHADILTWQSSSLFSGIICNPPYFNAGKSSENRSRAQARHTNSLPHESLLEQCRQLLMPSGTAAFILPTIEGEQFIQTAQENGWFMQRCCYVAMTEKKSASRILLELTLQPTKTVHETLVIRHNGQYTQAFTALTRDFYLKM
ncbi:MAG: tRNA1(Val) (adenine(37)-N6)-methyltransferase [Vibrio sp.]